MVDTRRDIGMAKEDWPPAITAPSPLFNQMHQISFWKLHKIHTLANNRWCRFSSKWSCLDCKFLILEKRKSMLCLGSINWKCFLQLFTQFNYLDVRHGDWVLDQSLFGVMDLFDENSYHVAKHRIAIWEEKGLDVLFPRFSSKMVGSKAINAGGD